MTVGLKNLSPTQNKIKLIPEKIVSQQLEIIKSFSSQDQRGKDRINELLSKKLITKEGLYMNAFNGRPPIKYVYREIAADIERQHDQEAIKVEKERIPAHIARFIDFETITGNLLKQGNKACELFGWTLPAIPSAVLSKIGINGDLFIISALRQEELIELFESFGKMVREYEEIKHLNFISAAAEIPHYHNGVGGLFFNKNFEFKNRLVKFFTNPLLMEAHHRNKWEATQKFLDEFNIRSFKNYVPPFPLEVTTGNLDFVIEHNGFAFVSEYQKEGIIIETDRVLKPGGVICWKDIPEQLAAILYYGESIFTRYQRINLPNLHFPSEWLILKKIK